MNIHTITLYNAITGKLRRRTVDIPALVRECAESAAFAAQGLAWIASYGGSVPNSYGYPARTECAVLVGIRGEDGNITVFVSAAEIAANKVTLSGTFRACNLGAFRALVDPRYGETAAKDARVGLYAHCAAQMIQSAVG